MPIAESDKAKAAFRTSSGQLYEFNQVLFGLCNAPATFSRLMDRVLAGLHWETCLFYLDDIIVFSSTWEEHLARLRQVFERLRHTKLKLGADKCTFAAKEVSYLGHRATEEGLLPDSSLLAGFREIPPPKTATEVCSFLGLAGYYRRYVKGFAAIAGPLHALTRKDAVFHWSAECQAAFDRLKHLLTTSPITAFPDFSQAFRLYTDASTAGLGAILAQIRDGKERIICCASRDLNQAEKAYPATKLECLAIMWAVAKFRPYLSSRLAYGTSHPCSYYDRGIKVRTRVGQNSLMFELLPIHGSFSMPTITLNILAYSNTSSILTHLTTFNTISFMTTIISSYFLFFKLLLSYVLLLYIPHIFKHAK